MTPEEQEHGVQTAGQSTTEGGVQDPPLEVDDASNSLLSPASSEDEMSWRIDTPPVKMANAVNNGDQEQVHDAEVAAPQTKQSDFADIWQEEASRSSNLSSGAARSTPEFPYEQDIFTDIATSMTTRSKPARIRRQKASNECTDSDEPASSRDLTQLPVEPVNPESNEAGIRNNSLAKDTTKQDDDTENGSDDSDDTGVFFQSNMPGNFQKQHTYERGNRKSEKVSLSSLLDHGESLLPESSPPVVAKTSPAIARNPFVATPPHFPGYPCSPSKSSPLRQEIHDFDISSDPVQSVQEESSLPIIQSSPFRTIVDGESILSVASDQRQFRAEMEGATDPSIVRVREEADGYLDAYEPQERSLDEITEITEPSRTWCGEQTSNPTRPGQNPAQLRQQSPSQRSTPKFSNHHVTASTRNSTLKAVRRFSEEEDEVSTESPEHKDPESSCNPREGSEIGSNVVKSLGTLGEDSSARPNTSLYSAFHKSVSPAAHPILSRHVALPKIEPWTRTHYKTLDKLYSTHLKHPALFLPSLNPPTPLSHTNEHLLQKFLAAHKHPYVGATFSAWGYNMVMTESLVVLCAVFMELLRLDDIEQYEVQTKTGIEMGQCAPGRMGDLIEGEEVVRRLATVVLGEHVRRDEKKGLRIDRSKTLTISWPQ